MFSHVSRKEAAQLLIGGGILIYPTETFYAIGCVATNARALAAVCKIKMRPMEKPLPLLACSINQANLAVEVESAPPGLLARFWPGPLTILLPARANLPQYARNGQNLAAIRVSGGGAAQYLAREAAFPLASTSANISGMAAAASHKDLAPRLFEACARAGLPFGLLAEDGADRPSKPSTIIEMVKTSENGCQLHILRQGVIDRKTLQNENFDVID